MNVLLLSCHSVLEFDELRMWSEIPGIKLMSPGAYWEPEKGCALRPGLKLEVPEDWRHTWSTIRPTPEQPDHKDHITPASIEPFDVVVVMHHWPWIFDNWEAFKGKTVVWRDIGQTSPEDELSNIKQAKDLGVKIVRYWDGYQARDNYQGHDAIIPFGKYKEDFPHWQGGRQAVMGLSQSIKHRNEACRFPCWETSTQGLARVMFGNGNEDLPYFGGPADYHKMLNNMTQYNSFWYGGTRPAPYTLALMEAMFVGIPVFTVADPGWESAVTDLVGDVGLVDSSSELHERLKECISMGRPILNMIAQAQRKTAQSFWDASVIKPKWEAFFRSL